MWSSAIVIAAMPPLHSMRRAPVFTSIFLDLVPCHSYASTAPSRSLRGDRPGERARSIHLVKLITVCLKTSEPRREGPAVESRLECEVATFVRELADSIQHYAACGEGNGLWRERRQSSSDGVCIHELMNLQRITTATWEPMRAIQRRCAEAMEPDDRRLVPTDGEAPCFGVEWSHPVGAGKRAMGEKHNVQKR
jgi:hypothetical protein